MASLYLHIPFCTKRCVYCDFYFVTTQRDYGRYVRALQGELISYARSFGGTLAAETVHFGGGTPSLLSLRETAQLLETILEHYDSSDLGEVGFETNPENATPEYLGGLRGLGVTRLSVGVQSFFGEDLTFMGRAHDATQAADALEQATRAGFQSVSVDLIFGLPDQPFERWMANLERAVDAGVDHVSTYGLTIEERTPLAKQVSRGLVRPVEDDAMGEQYLATVDYLTSEGFEHYEISNFARPGHRSRHNEAYWSHADYLGFGPSAHSFKWMTSGTASRWSNVRNLRQYVAILEQRQRPIDRQETLSLDELADEYVLLRLRQPADGLDLDLLESRYGVDLLTEKIEELSELERGGLARIRNGRLHLTARGALMADAVTARLLPDLNHHDP